MIKIAARFTPFSHQIGASSLIPGSPFIVEAYPTKLCFISEKEVYETPLEVIGPVEGFTLQQDLEKDRILLFGRGKSGYFYYTITHAGKKIQVERLRGETTTLEVESEPFSPMHRERLSLGMHKKLDWDLVLRRKELKEMLPLLFFLGQKIPPLGREKGQKLESLEDFSTFLQVGFRGILVPKRFDNLFQGLGWSGVPMHLSLLSSLREGYEAIRSFFIQEKEQIDILPKLPKEFFSGRLVDIATEKTLLDIEWTKGKLRQVTLRPKVTGKLSFSFPKELSSFRIRQKIGEKGSFISTKEALFLTQGERYFLDNFQK
jgi:hypothetical protein